MTEQRSRRKRTRSSAATEPENSLTNSIEQTFFKDQANSTDEGNKPTDENFECPICMEEDRMEVAILPCNHKFCEACLKSWAQNENSCPLCKARFPHYDRIQKVYHERSKQMKQKKRCIKVKRRSQATNNYIPIMQVFDADRARPLATDRDMLRLFHLTMNVLLDDDNDNDNDVDEFEGVGSLAHPIDLLNDNDDLVLPFRSGTSSGRTSSPVLVDLTGDEEVVELDGIARFPTRPSRLSAQEVEADVREIFEQVELEEEPPSRPSRLPATREARVMNRVAVRTGLDLRNVRD